MVFGIYFDTSGCLVSHYRYTPVYHDKIMTGRRTQVEVLEHILKSIEEGNRKTHEFLQNLINKSNQDPDVDLNQITHQISISYIYKINNSHILAHFIDNEFYITL